MKISIDVTIKLIEVSQGYIAYVEEIPGANAQGTTKKEAIANVREAARDVLTANRELSQAFIRLGQRIADNPGSS